MIIITPTKGYQVDISVVSEMFKTGNFPDKIFQNSIWLNSSEELRKLGYCNPVDKLQKIEEIISDLVTIAQSTNRNLCVYIDDESVIDVCNTVLVEKRLKDNYMILFHTENNSVILDDIFKYGEYGVLRDAAWEKFSAVLSYLARKARSTLDWREGR